MIKIVLKLEIIVIVQVNEKVQHISICNLKFNWSNEILVFFITAQIMIIILL